MSTQRQTRSSAQNAAAKVADEVSMPMATSTNEPTPAPATCGRRSCKGKAQGAKAGAEPKIAAPGRMHKRALSPEATVTETVPKGPERLAIPKQKRSKVVLIFSEQYQILIILL